MKSAPTDFLKLYLRHVGRSEIPESFHYWSAISLIAACVSDRVWYKKFADSKMFPNLYVMLIGPSGLGKGNAINPALKFVKPANIQERVRPYIGNITKQALIDVLSQRKRKEQPVTRLWFISPELGDDVPPGPLGEDLIRFLTKIYEGDFPLPIKERTRTHGLREISQPILNWLSGTTPEWLRLSLPKYAIEGGSFARICSIQVNYDLDKRIYEPEYPPDRDNLINALHAHVKLLSAVGGEFRMSDEAKAIDRQWYMTRETEQDGSLIPIWRRNHDMVLKLAMILSLAGDPLNLLIDSMHIKTAQKLIHVLYRNAPSMLRLASNSPEVEGLQRVADIIKRLGQVQRFVLMRMVSNRGINKDKLDRQIIPTLLGERRITVKESKRGGAVYVWLEDGAVVKASLKE